MTPRIILSKDYGQFGNRLFTFSNLLAYALENNLCVHNLSFAKYSQYFHYFQHDLVATWPRSESCFFFKRLINTKIGFRVAKKLLHKSSIVSLLRSTGNLFEADDLTELKAEDVQLRLALSRRHTIVWTAWNLHFDDLRNKHRSSLVEIFKPTKDIDDYTIQILTSIPRGAYTVGVHIRRGDYLTYFNGSYYFSFEMYEQLMLHVVSLMKPLSLHFIISSNEIVPRSLFSKLSVTFLSGSEAQDNYTIAKCDLIMGPPSTFSDWASFYGNTKRFVFTGIFPDSL